MFIIVLYHHVDGAKDWKNHWLTRDVYLLYLPTISKFRANFSARISMQFTEFVETEKTLFLLIVLRRQVLLVFSATWGTVRHCYYKIEIRDYLPSNRWKNNVKSAYHLCWVRTQIVSLCFFVTMVHREKKRNQLVFEVMFSGSKSTSCEYCERRYQLIQRVRKYNWGFNVHIHVETNFIFPTLD